MALPAYQAASIQQFSHPSQVLGGDRTFRAVLPAGYAESQKRYPVLYWLTGFEQAEPEREAAFVQYAAAHDLIVVIAGPVETAGEYPLYFPELVDQTDRSLRTIADREHRAVTGFFAAGFAAYLIAGKYPDLVSSASSIRGAPEGSAGPKNFAVEYRLDDHYASFEGVRTRLVTEPGDPMGFYQRRMNTTWAEAGADHETASDPDIAGTLDFHMKSFENPPPRPSPFQHADAWPNFSVWGWQVVSNRRRPGFTVLENAGPQGFRCTVREWVPDGTVISEVKLSITSPRLAAPGTARTITYLRLRDGQFRQATQKADGEGRFSFELDGDAWEVGIGAAPQPVVTGYEIEEQPWAAAGQPVKLRVRFRNKGAARYASGDVRWTSGNGGVTIEPAVTRMFGMAPGEASSVPVTVAAGSGGLVRIMAEVGAARLLLEIRLFPAAENAAVFRIADGAAVPAYRHASETAEITFGTGNGDGHAAPGETFAVLFPDGEWLRAAELFTNDACVDLGLRASDSWGQTSVRYSLPRLREDCPPGKIIRMLARVEYPGPRVRYFRLEFPVWYRPE